VPFTPMLASLEKKPFSSPEWIFEPKLDGYRTLSFIRRGKVRLISRNGVDVSAQYPLITSGLNSQAAEELVLDGEIVALDEQGRTCFQCLQDRFFNKPGSRSSHPPVNHPILYYVFDILYLNGYDCRSVSLYRRKGLLKEVLVSSNYVRQVEYLENDGETLYEASLSQGLEGIIAKRKDSTYSAGKRSRDWVKIKSFLSDEFIIGGYTRGAGNREEAFGALLLGTLDDSGKLVFAGHAGTGFDDRSLSEIKKRLEAIRTDVNPFGRTPPINAPAIWVKPQLVAEIKFSERTSDGLLRTPVFLRLREDKPVAEVRQDIVDSQPLVPDQSFQLSAVNDLLKQLDNPRESFEVEVEGYKISLSNLDKALWPPFENQPAVTKRDLLVYLTRVAPYFLPHLKDRPLTLTRFPNGIGGESFYQKHWKGSHPDFLRTVAISEHAGTRQDYLIGNNLATLVWLGQMDNIDIHTWFSRTTPDISIPESGGQEGNPDFFTEYPDFIIFDMDPYIYSGKEIAGAEPELNRKAFQKTCEMALKLKDILDSLSLSSFIKTSGKTGLHIYVPVVRQFDFHAVHSAAKIISSFLQQKHVPDVTLEWAVEKRAGKVFLDYNQNVRGKTLASVYSPRPTPLATVSTPLGWDEIGKIYPTDFTIFSVPARLSRTGDLWSHILEKRSDLKSILGMNR
jgi:bifunctional non-homologous end joining protein LigD